MRRVPTRELTVLRVSAVPVSISHTKLASHMQEASWKTPHNTLLKDNQSSTSLPSSEVTQEDACAFYGT